MFAPRPVAIVIALALLSGCSAISSPIRIAPAQPVAGGMAAYIVPQVALLGKSPAQIPGFIEAHYTRLQLPASPSLIERTNYYVVPVCRNIPNWSRGSYHLVKYGEPILLSC